MRLLAFLFASLLQFHHQRFGVLIALRRQQLLHRPIVFDDFLASPFVRELLDFIPSGQRFHFAQPKLTVVLLLLAHALQPLGALLVQLDNGVESLTHLALQFNAIVLRGDLFELLAAQYVQ